MEMASKKSPLQNVHERRNTLTRMSYVVYVFVFGEVRSEIVGGNKWMWRHICFHCTEQIYRISDL